MSWRDMVGWPPKDLRAFLALVASVAGASALTLYSAFIILILWAGGWGPNHQSEIIRVLGQALLLSLAGSLVVLISLGLAINRRSIKVSRDGIDVSGGDEPVEAKVEVKDNA